MTTLTAETVISNLPSIGYDGLLKVQQALTLLLGDEPSGGGPEHPEGFEAVLFDAMQAELTSRGIHRNIPFSTFRRSSNYRHWRSSMPVIQDWLESEFNGHVKGKREKMALCRLLVSTLCDELKQRRLPISSSTIASNVGRLSEVFDNAFPGYLQCGMAHIVPLMLKRKGLA